MEPIKGTEKIYMALFNTTIRQKRSNLPSLYIRTVEYVLHTKNWKI